MGALIAANGHLHGNRLLLGSRVGFVEVASDLVGGQVGIDLSCGDLGMA
jgi:hypothetical protein